MIIKNISKLRKSEILELTKRPLMEYKNILEITRLIIDEVKIRGDEAIRDFTKRFDQIELKNLKVEKNVFKAAQKNLSRKIKTAFNQAASNIETFHRSQLKKEKPVSTMPGVLCFRESRALESVGFYVPGGTAVLPSTVLMLGIPARIAGCKNIVLCTPPKKDGTVSAEILYAAAVSGITNIFMIGGAQAISAMAYGTESIPKVDKIFGPGNQYVTAAKMIVSTDISAQVAIDMPAGPSEVLVIADETANPTFVAADLLSQAEHGIDSQVVLVTPDKTLVKKVSREIEKQLVKLPRKAIAEKALKKSLILKVRDLKEAFSFSNAYAPEHLILQIKNPKKYLAQIENAGSVFIGPWSPESAGDYASGTNHTLPTYGYAKSYSGVSVENFVKKITFQKLTKKGLKNVGKTIETLAECEGLEAHKNAVSIRLQNL